jgi:CheY-like chemotaxis protein
MRMRGAQSRETEVLERQVGYLTRLVDDLLDVSRITRGKIELRRERLEIGDVLLKALEIAAPLLEQRAHRVEVQVPRRGHAVMGDGERLAQVFSNLLTNAAKYSDPQSRIAVRARRHGDRVQVSVIDEGAGIAPEMLDKVFDLFVQQPQTFARAEGGLGLGLAIVRNLVQLHGGTVSVRSEGIGKGSEFVVELPAATHEARAASAPPPPPRAQPAAGTRVLVVDDNRDIVSMMTEALRGLGYDVATATDGPEALAVARAFRPEIAVIDIGLPVMDGYELAEHLRRDTEFGPSLRLLAVTGYGLEADRRRALDLGFENHLVKPVAVAKLHVLMSAGG